MKTTYSPEISVPTWSHTQYKKHEDGGIQSSIKDTRWIDFMHVNLYWIQGGSNMTGTVYTCLHTNKSRSYLNHLVLLGWSRRKRWTGHVVHTDVEERCLHTRFFWGEPAAKRPLGRPRLRWEDNVKIDHTTISQIIQLGEHFCLNIFIYVSSLHVSGIQVLIIRRKLPYLCDTGISHSERSYF